jgi:hypothetical protein
MHRKDFPIKVANERAKMIFAINFSIFLENKKSRLPLQSQNKRRVGQGVKTPPFHGGITGSIPVRATKKVLLIEWDFFVFRDVSSLFYYLEIKAPI